MALPEIPGKEPTPSCDWRTAVHYFSPCFGHRPIARPASVGSFPSLNARPLHELDEWLHEIREALDKHDAEKPRSALGALCRQHDEVHKSNMRLEKDMELVMKLIQGADRHQPSLGARPEVNDAVHSYGGITLHDVINQTYCRQCRWPKRAPTA